MSLSIRTAATDTDPYAIQIAQRLAENLQAVGIDAQVVPLSERQLLGDVLVSHDFDLAVGVHPGVSDPDVLRPLLHSYFSGEAGWQNPFGFADVRVDRLLEEQVQQADATRRETVHRLLGEIALRQPFVPIAFPDVLTAVRTDRYTGWDSTGVADTTGYFGLEDRTEKSVDDESPGPSTLRVALPDGRLTENRNPLAVEFRDNSTILGLLYDPLCRQVGGRLRPWLARSWRWREDADGQSTVSIRLREGVTWHDGTALTADDVAFTYRFLADTSMGTRGTPVPAPRFRDRTSLVDSVDVVDEYTLAVTVDATPEVAVRTLSVPVLPKRVWQTHTGGATVGGVGVSDTVTEAIVWDNPDPIGSGPFAFSRAEPGRRLVLDRVDDHFIDEMEGGRLGPAGEAVRARPFERIEFQVAPSDTGAVHLVATDDADVTGPHIHAGALDSFEHDPDVEIHTGASTAFYHVACNTRIAPLSNPNFRRTIARLLDKEFLVETVFDGYGRPTSSPVAPSEFLPPSLEWTGEDPEVPFAGTEGELDVPAARTALVDAGYRYDDDRLLRS